MRQNVKFKTIRKNNGSLDDKMSKKTHVDKEEEMGYPIMRKLIQETGVATHYTNGEAFSMPRKQEHTFARKKRSGIIDTLNLVYGFRCWYCGYRFKDNSEVRIDHIESYADGGTAELDNLALSCLYCNTHKFYYPVTRFLEYLARIRTGQFECPILKRLSSELEPTVRDILSKSFYKDNE